MLPVRALIKHAAVTGNVPSQLFGIASAGADGTPAVLFRLLVPTVVAVTGVGLPFFVGGGGKPKRALIIAIFDLLCSRRLKI